MGGGKHRITYIWWKPLIVEQKQQQTAASSSQNLKIETLNLTIPLLTAKSILNDSNEKETGYWLCVCAHVHSMVQCGRMSIYLQTNLILFSDYHFYNLLNFNVWHARVKHLRHNMPHMAKEIDIHDCSLPAVFLQKRRLTLCKGVDLHTYRLDVMVNVDILRKLASWLLIYYPGCFYSFVLFVLVIQL